MSTENKTENVCKYCEKSFARPESLAVHVCEQKRRYQDRDEPGVRLGMQAYLRFYEMTQGSARLKTFDDFARSPYYRAFVKFGRYCVDIRAVNTARFVEWVVEKNKKIDHWCRDSVYSEYLSDYMRKESVSDALARAIEYSIDWAENNRHPAHDCIRYGNSNAISYAISTGRISAWVLYNCESGQRYLDDLDQDQMAIVWPWIEPEFWQRKFRDYPADQEYAREMLAKAGW